VIVGNDVVDLGDPECRLESLHPRWAGRVFAESERAALERAGGGPGEGPEARSERRRLAWALWAAKESAYKAVKRRDPRTVFAPASFVVELSDLPPGEGVVAGRVRHSGERLAVAVRLAGDYVHAVAASGTAASPVRAAVERAVEDASGAARRLAIAHVGRALGIPPDTLAVAGRPPVLRRHGRPLDACLSLSHHGRFVAFACAGPQGGSAHE
jgi:phosphopantetheinyl transferase (holo-ACP synthase)